jgi:hypothetical protein
MDGLAGILIGLLVAAAILVALGGLVLRAACWLLYVEAPSFGRAIAIVFAQWFASMVVGFILGIAMGAAVGHDGVSGPMIHGMNLVLNMLIAAGIYVKFLRLSYLKAIGLFWVWLIACAILATIVTMLFLVLVAQLQ